MKLWKLKGLIITTLFLVLLILIYHKFVNEKLLVEKKDIITNNEEDLRNSNIIKDIKYSSKDLKGNEYVIFAEEGEIDYTNSDIIFLKKVKAQIKLIEKNEIITILSDFGKYNSINYDTIFSKNVVVKYLESKLTGDYLDFAMMNNTLVMSKKVVYTNPKNILKADVIELNTITKDTKIFMYNSNNKVEVVSR